MLSCCNKNIFTFSIILAAMLAGSTVKAQERRHLRRIYNRQTQLDDYRPNNRPRRYPTLDFRGNNLGRGQLGKCEGDCDSDRDCAPGLVCFRDERDAYVPGCQGTRRYDRRRGYVDYCYDPWDDNAYVLGGAGPIQVATTPVIVHQHRPHLEFLGNDLGRGRLGECQGDCDSDRDCANGLVCYENPNSDTVPGCQGRRRNSRRGYVDYCYDPRNGGVAAAPRGGRPIQNVEWVETQEVVTPSFVAPRPDFLGERNEDVLSVRGGGTGRGPNGSFPDQPNSSKRLVYLTRNPQRGSLGECQGHCSGDSDCQPGFKCFKNQTYDYVPGCKTQRVMDDYGDLINYCIDPRSHFRI